MDTPKTILIIEDDAILLSMLVDTFTKQLFNVRQAKNGIEGIAELTATKPDLILLDVDMPQLNGVAMLKMLDEASRRIPVIMLTNLNNPQLIADAAELGVTEYLIKADWELDDIAVRVKKRLHIPEDTAPQS